MTEEEMRQAVDDQFEAHKNLNLDLTSLTNDLMGIKMTLSVSTDTVSSIASLVCLNYS